MRHQNIQNLLKERYYIEGENTWEDIAKRVSELHPPIFEYIKDFSFVPSSPTLMNACTNGKRKGTLSSCFIIDIEDDMQSIMNTMSEAAIITQKMGGVGCNFSKLRSSQEMIKSVGRTSGGVLPFISLMNSVLENIFQGAARRGAGMSMYNIYGGDIIKFIKAKQNLNNYERNNFSVGIPDEFYETLLSTPAKQFKIQEVTTGEWKELKNDNGICLTYQDIWDLIIDCAWNSAEPGIFHTDTASNQCTCKHIDRNVFSNPCMPNFVNLLSPSGIKQLKDINIGDSIWSKEGWTKIINKWSTGVKEVTSWKTKTGTICLTENHKIVSGGEKIDIGDAEDIDIIKGVKYDKLSLIPEVIMDGLMIGDGTRSINPSKNYDCYLNIGRKDSDYFESEVKDIILGKTYPLEDATYRVKTSITKDELPKLPNRCIPDRFIYAAPNIVASFLRGLYSANGSICGSRVTLKTTNFILVEQVQVMLNSIGISSYYTSNKPNKSQWKNGIYTSRTSYDINISTDREVFYNLVGFIQKYKMEKLSLIINDTKKINRKKINYEIIEKESIGEMEVFDITVDNNSHTFWCEGFDISNCSEFTHIPYTSCNLGSLNISKFIKYKKIDFEELDKAIEEATLFLNAVIDNNAFPLEKIKKRTLASRPLGLGQMGWAHALYKMEIPYGSPDAVQLQNELMYRITIVSMLKSIEIAKEKGRGFEYFDYDTFMSANERFFNKISAFTNLNELKDKIKKYECYNSSQTSIAPTGSLSVIANCSSGIEPVYALVYYRRIEKLNKEYETVTIVDSIFEDYVNKNHKDNKDKIYRYIAEHNGSCKGCKLLTDHEQNVFCTASDLTPTHHLDMLEATARNTSMSVSKTVNMPTTATKKEISDLYIDAWKRGIIGVTVYRDGCRENILHTGNTNNKNIVINSAPERPEAVNADVYHFLISKHKYCVVVGLLGKQPYEIFSFENYTNDGETYIPKSVEHGKIKRLAKQKYVLMTEEQKEFHLTNGHNDPSADGLTRAMSRALRHGTPVDELVGDMEKVAGPLTSFAKSIGRALKHYVEDGTEVKGELCPDCGSKIIRESGCQRCSNCTWSKCG